MSLVHRPETSASGAEVGAAGVSRSRHWLGAGGWAVAGVLMAALAVAAWLRPPPFVDADPPMVRFQIERSTDIYSASTVAFAVSPDGLRLAHYGPASGGQQSLYVRTLATGDVREIPGSAAATLRVVSLVLVARRPATRSTAPRRRRSWPISRPAPRDRFAIADLSAEAGTVTERSCSARFKARLAGSGGLIANDPTPVVVTNADPRNGRRTSGPCFCRTGGGFSSRASFAGTCSRHIRGDARRRDPDAGHRRIATPLRAGRRGSKCIPARNGRGGSCRTAVR